MPPSTGSICTVAYGASPKYRYNTLILSSGLST